MRDKMFTGTESLFPGNFWDLISIAQNFWMFSVFEKVHYRFMGNGCE